jgi:NAD+ diphosphatase
MADWQPRFDPAARPSARSLVFAFHGGRMLAPDGSVPRLEELPAELLEGPRPLCVGMLDGEPCFAAAVGELDGMTPLRALLERLPQPLPEAAARAAQTVEWEVAHAFCGRCGAATEPSETELARICPSCGAHYYPRISPAVIMLVTRGDRLLLARRPQGGFWSVLAGFVDPAETLEQAVVREVREEVGLGVGGVRYFGSQPWPFPSQLMVGFTARAEPGELRLDETELAEAGWFGPDDELPPIPPPFTIARRLIDSFRGR